MGSGRPDFDGDRKPDLAVAANRAVAVALSDGTNRVVKDLDWVDKGPEDGLAVPDGPLATGDLTGDGYDDLAVTTILPNSYSGDEPPEDWEESLVWVLSGGPQGTLTGNGAIAPLVLGAGLHGVPGSPHEDTDFGYSLAAGDLTGVGSYALDGNMFHPELLFLGSVVADPAASSARR